MKSSHEEFIKLPNGGHAFITGVPDSCDHDDKEIVFTLANGEVLWERDYRKTTGKDTFEYVDNIAKNKNTYINGQTCGCSKCGKVLTLQDLMGDAYWL